MSAKYVTKAEFSRLCGVTNGAVQQAIKKGKISVSSNGKINVYLPANRQYRQNAVERKSKLHRGRQETAAAEALARERSATPTGQMFALPPPLELDEGPEWDPHDVYSQNSGRSLPPPPTWSHNSHTEPNGSDPDITHSEIDYAIEKMRSTTAINKARLAEMVRATIRRDFVDRVISLIGTTISDHIITMGDRLASDLAALAGSTDARSIREIKEAIDDDTRKTLREMKLVVEQHYTQKLEMD